MHPRSLHRDLFSHNDWGWHKIFTLAEGVSPAQLDQPFTMGLGSLRATLDHVCQAERLWLDRWQNKPWAPLPAPDPSTSLADLRQTFRETAAERDSFFDKANAAQPIHYRNTSGHSFTHKLGDLALHVVNHGVHHRAQALNMLRRVGLAVPGLDYLTFRLEQPTVELSPDLIERLRKRGGTVADKLTEPPHLDLETVRFYYDYSDWGTRKMLEAAERLSAAQLDQPFEMGPGTLRKTLLHIRDAEQWWLDSWTRGPESSFPNTPPTTSIADARAQFDQTAAGRRDYLAGLTETDLQRTTHAKPGGATILSMRLGESMLQLCCHGTHHRAQVLNMLRQLGETPPMLDLVMWLRERV